MENKELTEELKNIVQVDIDAVHTYDKVLEEISDQIVRSRLTEFRDNHLKHIEAVSDKIRSMGEKPPELAKDFKGHVIEAFAAVGAAAGMKNALRALKTAEKITSRYYGEIVSKEVPSDLKDLFRKHFSDEKIHLEYIENNLKAL